MRGFGVTASDFAIEVHMDKVAETVGMNPIELRILNAYRDGDMKAHRRKAKNTALVECCQAVAQKAGVSLGAAYASDSSKQKGGTADRVAIPETVSDMEGQIGERRNTNISTSPAVQGSITIPAGQANDALSAVAPQRDDMQIALDRVGHKVSADTTELVANEALPQHGNAAPSYGTLSQPSGPLSNTHSTVSAASPANAPAPQTTESQNTPVAQPAPYAPAKPFDRGSNRPGSNRRFSNRGRR